MRRFLGILAGNFLIFSILSLSTPLQGQQPCPGFPGVAMATPEDYMIQDILEVTETAEKIEVLDDFVKENPDSNFLPCAEEYYTIYYLQLQDYDKTIEHGEKAAAAGKAGFLLFLSLTKGYIGKSGPAERGAEAAILATEKLNVALENPPAGEQDPEGLRERLLANLPYLRYTFFQFLTRVADPAQRIPFLERFVERYPGTDAKTQVNLQYFVAYKMANNQAKVIEYGEKAVAESPEDVMTLNTVAEDFAGRGVKLAESSQYAQKVLELAPNMPKPDHLSEEVWAKNKNAQLGSAHETLGTLNMRRERYLTATKDFKTALELLESDPRHSRALFRLGYTYAMMPAVPANLRQAERYLAQAAAVSSPWQAEAKNILAKVRAAAGK